jgi:outer membrane receptor for ferrienterochelin and colicins
VNKVAQTGSAAAIRRGPRRCIPTGASLQRSLMPRGWLSTLVALGVASQALMAGGLAQAQEAEGKDGASAVDALDLVKVLNVEVSTASKRAESLEDAPAVITVVTRKDIERWGYQSVAEVLDHTVGFYLSDDHILPNVAVRGMTGGLGAESSVIKVMIDGRSVAFRSTSGNWLGVELIPLGAIEQIEIIRGPASALYGADAFLGVINIITISPEQLRPLRVRVAAGMSQGEPQLRLDAVGGGKWGRFDFLLGAAAEDADRSGLVLPSESPAPTLPSGIGGRREALNLERRSLSLQGRVGYRVPEHGQLVLSAFASGIERGGDFAHWTQLSNGPLYNGNPGGTRIGLGQMRFNLDGLVHASSVLEVQAQTTYYQGGVLPQDRVEIGSTLFYVERKQSYRGTDSVVEVRYTPTERFNAVAGAELIMDREELPSAERVDRVTGETITGWSSEARPSHVDLTNLGAFLSANYKVFDPWLKLTAGGRYDHHSEYGSQVTGRVGATSHLHSNLVLKLLYGSAFKAPAPYLLYAVPLRPGDVVGNPELAPQHIRTAEVQLSYKPSRFVEASTGVSESWLEGKAEFTPQGINQTARNVASQQSTAWESRIDVRHYNDFWLYGAFEWVVSSRELGQEGYAAGVIGENNVVYPPWIGRAGALVGIPSVPSMPLDLGSQVRIVGRRRAADTTLVEAGHDVSFAPYVMLDASLTARELYLLPKQETRISLRARNLLGVTGPDPGFSGFEYPLRPPEIFLELEHLY